VKICAVIPAAGHGTRLGGDGPKILTPLTQTETIWSILHAKLSPLVDHVHLVLSPEGEKLFADRPPNVSYSIQPTPTGMGDAIFRGHAIWTEYDAILIVWGDQVFVSSDTLQRAITALTATKQQAILPVTRMAVPYVEYVFEGGRLTQVLQTREGDATISNGFSDVGTFLLTTSGLQQDWQSYLSSAPRGGKTGEVNFLPFLPFLSARSWTIQPLEVADATEARGINTPDDLAFFRNLYKNA
jgi:bifunctional UDP-N-acetylglucosamine pyrophosphorylase/glucosamine-1-phosphate N-acetyltransferase